MKKCPFCGSEKGYYIYEKVHRALFFTYDDEPNGSTEDVEDYVGKRRYCEDCRNILPRKMFENEELSEV